MPTAIPSGEKNAFIALVRVKLPIEADRLVTILVNYEDISVALCRELFFYDSNPNLLTQMMAVFTDAQLLNVGIYNNKTSSSLLTNPMYIINSTYTGGVSVTADAERLIILGESTVSTITVATTKEVGFLYIGSGCSVDVADSTAVDAFINRLYVEYSRSRSGRLNTIKSESGIGQLYVAPLAYFGGYSDNVPAATCADAVTDLVANNITHNSVVLSWTAPTANFVEISIAYKKNESEVWIPADDIIGDYVGNTGYVFRKLEPDTYYNFGVFVTCNNGGVAATYVSAQTVCCGAGGMSMTKGCWVTALIKTSPDPAELQTLCNGTIIPLEYPVGTTLTIPLLIGSRIDQIVIDNTQQQLFPFNPATGTFDAAATPLLSFIDGNVITFIANLPV